MTKKVQKIKYKKAPGAPRRFKSPYMFFSEHQHKVIRNQIKDKKLRAAVVAKMVSQAWKELPDNEKNKWIEMGRLDRERYEREKKEYKGPWKIPDIKNPNAPKKPMSSFLAFSNERRRSLAKANPNLNGTELSCLLAKLWKECPDEIKQKYRERELREREMFKQCRAEWERRQHLAARVAQWTESMPNGQDLCREFMDDEDETESSCYTSESSSTAPQDDYWCVPANNIAIASGALKMVKLGEIRGIESSLENSDAPVPVNYFQNGSSVNPVPTLDGSTFGNMPVLSQLASTKELVLEKAQTLPPSSSSCYDHYSLDDILQDDELFEDFSPRDVPSVPTSNAHPINNNATTNPPGW